MPKSHFTFDEKKVEKIVPNFDGTATIYFKNGKSKSFPWDGDFTAFENRVHTDNDTKGEV